MPGLCGIVSSVHDFERCKGAFRRVNAVAGVALSETTCVTGDFLVLSLISPGLGQEHKVGRVDGADAVLILEGEIYNQAELSKSVSASAGASICSTLLEFYLDRGYEFVHLLDGEFNIVVYEPGHKRLTILNDHIASNPMYYWQQSNGFLFGSEKKSVLAVSLEQCEIDPVGLLQPFMHHHNLEDRTFLKDLKRLPPASRLTYAAGRTHIAGYGGILSGVTGSARGSELLERWKHELEVATAKRVHGKGRLVFSLSAGLDSRAIACSIARTRRPIWARTWGAPGSFEVEYAREIARSLDFGHLAENPDDYVLSDAVHKIVWRTDGETQFRNALSIFTHKQMKERGDHMIGGWLGDVTSGAHLRPFMLLPMNRGQFLQKVFDWYVAYGETQLRNVFNSQFLAEHFPTAKEAFFRSYDKVMDVPNARAHELWDIHNRQTRMTISSMPTDSHLFGKVRPFFDRSYLQFVMSIPLRWRIGQSLYKSLIYAMGPEIRRIPNSNTNLPLHSSPSANVGRYLQASSAGVARKLMKRIHAKFRPRLQQRATMDFASATRGDPGLGRIVEHFVRCESFDDRIFNRSAILEMLRAHYSGQADHSMLVGILATWSVALEYFAYGKVDACPPEAEPYVS